MPGWTKTHRGKRHPVFGGSKKRPSSTVWGDPLQAAIYNAAKQGAGDPYSVSQQVLSTYNPATTQLAGGAVKSAYQEAKNPPPPPPAGPTTFNEAAQTLLTNVLTGAQPAATPPPEMLRPITPTGTATPPQPTVTGYKPPPGLGQLEPVQQAMLQKLLEDITRPQGIAPQLQETMMRPVEAAAHEEARRARQQLEEQLAARGMARSGERVGGFTDIERQRMNQIISARQQLAQMSAQLQEARRQQALQMVPGLVESERGYGLEQQAMMLNYLTEAYKQQMGRAELSLAQQARDQGWSELELRRQAALAGLSDAEADRVLNYARLQQQYDELTTQTNLTRWLAEQGYLQAAKERKTGLIGDILSAVTFGLSDKIFGK